MRDLLIDLLIGYGCCKKIGQPFTKLNYCKDKQTHDSYYQINANWLVDLIYFVLRTKHFMDAFIHCHWNLLDIIMSQNIAQIFQWIFKNKFNKSINNNESAVYIIIDLNDHGITFTTLQPNWLYFKLENDLVTLPEQRFSFSLYLIKHNLMVWYKRNKSLSNRNISLVQISCLALPRNWFTSYQWARLIAGFLPQRPRFKPRSVYVGFVLDKMALEQFFF